MSWSPDANAKRDPGAWTIVAAGILGIQGVLMILYGGLLRPVLDATVDLPLLGRTQVIYLAGGLIAITAAIGVGRRQAWGRWLGVVAATMILVLELLAAYDVVRQALAVILPAIVLVILWQRWPDREPRDERHPPDASVRER